MAMRIAVSELPRPLVGGARTWRLGLRPLWPSRLSCLMCA